VYRILINVIILTTPGKRYKYGKGDKDNIKVINVRALINKSL